MNRIRALRTLLCVGGVFVFGDKAISKWETGRGYPDITLLEPEMTKQHYISFIAAASAERMQMVKLYPEGNAEARFKMSGVRELFFYCNKDGLFRRKI